MELRIADPDADGVGEVLARGPNVMLGYARRRAERDRRRPIVPTGWLTPATSASSTRTAASRIVGRKKDVIVDANGENVYPDEVEEAYSAIRRS